MGNGWVTYYPQMIFQKIGCGPLGPRSMTFALELARNIAESAGETGADCGESENGGNGDQRGD
jgi:hypothetical protein